MEFNGVPILVAGDVMLDYYITGSASRISPEAPVPVLSRRAAWSVPGGAANVARGLARLGCRPRLLGLVGHDATAEALRQQTAAEGIELGLIASARRQTTCKTRILAGAQQLLRVDEETVLKPDLEEKISLRLYLEKLLPGCRAVILSDYAKGVLLADEEGQSLAAATTLLARDAGIPVIADPKGVDWTRYAGADCVTPNTAEFLKVCSSLGLWHGGGEPGAPLRQALAGELCARFDLGRILLTRGGAGMTLYEPGREPVNIRAVSREVADVSGAGDTVAATLAACVALGEPWEKAAELANTAAGVAVGKLGTAPVGAAELENALSRGLDNPKIMDWPQLRENIARWRRENKKIVFTNGCFDLLHPGHVSLLRQAAAFGDALVVGLNSDDSVKRLKGPERPIQNEQSRAQVLAALQAVDAVAIFGEDTPVDLIHLVRPDVLVKGSDYRVEDIAGAGFVQASGGEVRLVDLVDGCSTSRLAARIRGGADGGDTRG